MKPDLPLPALPDHILAKGRAAAHWGWIRENIVIDCLVFYPGVGGTKPMVTVSFSKRQNGRFANPPQVMAELLAILRTRMGAVSHQENLRRLELLEEGEEEPDVIVFNQVGKELAIIDIYLRNEADLVMLRMLWGYDPNRGLPETQQFLVA